MGNTLPLLRAELARWPGVQHWVERGSRHPKLVLRCGGRERFLVFSKTKVAHYGLRQKVSELRRVLRELGGNSGHELEGQGDHGAADGAGA